MTAAQQDFNKLGYIGMSQPRSVDRGEWYTPARYIESVRAVLGEIDFDPYSDEIANLVVGAYRIRTKDTPPSCREYLPKNGRYSCRTVFCNPPYGRGLIEKAVGEFITEFARLRFEGIMLVNNATETKWFQMLLHHASALCLTDHRIAFYNVDGKAVSGNTRGQAFIYFGENSDRFLTEFSKFGFTTHVVTQENYDPAIH